MTNARHNTNTSKERLVSIGAFTLLLLLFAAYVYFLSVSVVHVVIRKEIGSEVSELNSKVAELEATYIKRQHAVSEKIAHQQGFVEVRDKIFLDRTSTLVVARE